MYFSHCINTKEGEGVRGDPKSPPPLPPYISSEEEGLAGRSLRGEGIKHMVVPLAGSRYGHEPGGTQQLPSSS